MKIFRALLVALLLPIAALAQPSPPPGPWDLNGASIYPVDNSMGVTIPSNVPGGNKGAGTINSAGMFINGVPVQGFGNEPRNSVLAGPPSGASVPPSFRSLVAADIPSLSSSYVTTWSGGTTGLTPSSGASGAIALGGLLIPPNGGTGVTTTSAIPSTATGSSSSRTLAARFADYTNVKNFGAVGDGTTDDTSAFTAAMTATCAKTGKGLYIPQSSSSYKITSTLTQCDGMAVVCDSGSTIHYTGTGALFFISASQSPRMKGCILQGNNAANTYGIHIGGAVSTAAVKPVFEQLSIINFGDVATGSGAGIQIDTDSQAVTIRESTFSNNGAGIATTAPTDTLDVHDNLITNPAGSAASCVSISAASGATTMQIRHNSLSCNGPAVTVNAGSGVVYLTDNEQENQSGVTLSGAHSTAYDIIAAGGVIAANNTCNVHSNNSYCWYIADGIQNSRFSGNTVNGTNTAGFRVGSGTANIYEYTRTDGSIGINYSVSTYPGIVSATSNSTTSTYSIGIGNGLPGFSVAMPGVAYDAGDAGQNTMMDSANTNRKFAFGYDGTREVGYVQVIKSGCCGEPLLLNPKGGGVWVYAPTFPALTGYVYANGSSAATVSTTVPWASLTGTPTTLAGYGITSPLPIAQGGTNCAAASGTCLDNITGFSGTGFIKRTGAGIYTFTSDPSDVASVFGRTGAVVAAANDYNFNQLAGSYTLAQGPTIAANTLLGETASGTPIALAVPSCSTSASALNWTSGTGLSCNTAVNAATLGGATFASPGTIGGTTAAPASFTSVTITGTGASALAIPGTSNNAVTFGGTAASNPALGRNGGTNLATVLGDSSDYAPHQAAYFSSHPNLGIPAGGSTAIGFFATSAQMGYFVGSGAATISAPQGSLYARSNGLPQYNTNGSTGWASLAPLDSPSFTGPSTFAGLIVPNSPATLTCGTGCASVSGNPQKFVVMSGTAQASVTVNFGITWSAAPVCAIGSGSTASVVDISSTTTTAITFGASVALTATPINVLCF